MEYIKVTKEGQIKQEHKLRVYSSRFSKFFDCTAKLIVYSGGNEEIIIDRKNNKYFITKNVINNSGGFGKWVNDVWIKKGETK
jgi:hypothetical protein